MQDSSRHGDKDCCPTATGYVFQGDICAPLIGLVGLPTEGHIGQANASATKSEANDIMVMFVGWDEKQLSCIPAAGKLLHSTALCMLVTGKEGVLRIITSCLKSATLIQR